MNKEKDRHNRNSRKGWGPGKKRKKKKVGKVKTNETHAQERKRGDDLGRYTVTDHRAANEVKKWVAWVSGKTSENERETENTERERKV